MNLTRLSPSMRCRGQRKLKNCRVALLSPDADDRHARRFDRTGRIDPCTDAHRVLALFRTPLALLSDLQLETGGQPVQASVPNLRGLSGLRRLLLAGLAKPRDKLFDQRILTQLRCTLTETLITRVVILSVTAILATLT